MGGDVVTRHDALGGQQHPQQAILKGGSRFHVHHDLARVLRRAASPRVHLTRYAKPPNTATQIRLVFMGPAPLEMLGWLAGFAGVSYPRSSPCR